MAVKNLGLRLEPEQHAALKDVAQRSGRSLQETALAAIDALIAGAPPDPDRLTLAEQNFLERMLRFYRTSPEGLRPSVVVVLEAARAGVMTDRERQREFGRFSGPADEAARAVERQEQIGAKAPKPQKTNRPA